MGARGGQASFDGQNLKSLKKRFPEKFGSIEHILSKISPGDKIFVGTACGEPQFLTGSLVEYVRTNPKAFFDAELIHVWSLGVAPYADSKFKKNFRFNSFFIGDNMRDAVNKGLADYTPIFLSEVPKLFASGRVPLDVALIQVSAPDEAGRMSLGVSVDITKAAVSSADLVIAQINPNMPRVFGDTMVDSFEIDYLVYHPEPLLTYRNDPPDNVSSKIGEYVSRIISDGDTIQVGYGSIPNAILANLSEKSDLGVHTELFTDGLCDLMRKGVINNKRKSIDPGVSIATFCMGGKDTYDFLDNNQAVNFRPTEYTNSPLVISRNENMVAINSALEIDLTGQATAESLGKTFYSGIGGQADFMRGAVLSKGGKTILAIQSTADGGRVSRIVPFIGEGAGVTLNRGDIHYVVTEYGIAYLHGKNIRERAMDLIAIADPKFRGELISQAKELGLIYKDQAFIPGKRGQYPRELEIYRTTYAGLRIKLRPVNISDEPKLKDFFYSLSDETSYKRFISARRDMPHERLQDFVIIDYTRETVILATLEEAGSEKIVGVGQYGIEEGAHSAEVALVVSDKYQGRGIGTEILRYLTYLAKKDGLLGFTAEVLTENRSMISLFEAMGYDIQKSRGGGIYDMRLIF